MAKIKTRHQAQFHRSQIGRAQRYIRLNLNERLSLSNIAKQAGSSSYHFVRLFLAYTGETPFDFLRRIRLATALRMLQEDAHGSITEIALSVGYETASAFNKVFKKSLHLNPSDFRNLGKERQYELIYDLSKPRMHKEIAVNLIPSFDVVTRPLTHYLFLEKHGPFAEIAPPTWNELFPLLSSHIDARQIVGYLGLSGIDKSKLGEDAMIYEAGLALTGPPEPMPQGLEYKRIKSGKYACFRLTGPYSQIWTAFSQIFKILGDSHVELRPEFCIENYLNDPKITPENELLTELLVPVA
ncbi:MAG: AraC family transcriptional regulator [Acidobacteria bacterium]|nr:AraC family transcriptional regulator [Acidobacteriota bacterium]